MNSFREASSALRGFVFNPDGLTHPQVISSRLVKLLRPMLSSGRSIQRKLTAAGIETDQASAAVKKALHHVCVNPEEEDKLLDEGGKLASKALDPSVANFVRSYSRRPSAFEVQESTSGGFKNFSISDKPKFAPPTILSLTKRIDDDLEVFDYSFGQGGFGLNGDPSSPQTGILHSVRDKRSFDQLNKLWARLVA